ncbi:30S ribosome-binding factor RbfA [Oceanibium sediminis]|uniref:30S ribosome-binding factor RbfA n=1 Tax=Oceanibium sediminis TaxID=2026339 RepID=UPI000DD41DEF|nr:30S ribosome-binding factor RbfA [Oceanibium sediminis]
MARQSTSGPSGPSQRQLRVGELIRRALSDTLARGDLFDPDLDKTSITVSEARITPDLKQATVYVLPLGGGEADLVIEALTRNKHELRRAVNKAVALKYSPELTFKVDHTFDRMDETRALLSDPKVQRDLAAPDED